MISLQLKRGLLLKANLRLMSQSPCHIGTEHPAALVSTKEAVYQINDGNAQKCTVGDIDDGIACLGGWLTHDVAGLGGV